MGQFLDNMRARRDARNGGCGVPIVQGTCVSQPPCAVEELQLPSSKEVTPIAPVQPISPSLPPGTTLTVKPDNTLQLSLTGDLASQPVTVLYTNANGNSRGVQFLRNSAWSDGYLSQDGGLHLSQQDNGTERVITIDPRNVKPGEPLKVQINGKEYVINVDQLKNEQRRVEPIPPAVPDPAPVPAPPPSIGPGPVLPPEPRPSGPIEDGSKPAGEPSAGPSKSGGNVVEPAKATPNATERLGWFDRNNPPTFIRLSDLRENDTGKMAAKIAVTYPSGEYVITDPNKPNETYTLQVLDAENFAITNRATNVRFVFHFDKASGGWEVAGIEPDGTKLANLSRERLENLAGKGCLIPSSMKGFIERPNSVLPALTVTHGLQNPDFSATLSLNASKELDGFLDKVGRQPGTYILPGAGSDFYIYEVKGPDLSVHVTVCNRDANGTQQVLEAFICKPGEKRGEWKVAAYRGDGQGGLVACSAAELESRNNDGNVNATYTTVLRNAKTFRDYLIPVLATAAVRDAL